MEENTTSFIHIALDVIIFVLAISALLYLVLAFSTMEDSNAKTMQTKINVSTATGDAVTTTLQLTRDEAYMQICLLAENKDVSITVQGHVLTETERNNITMNNAYAYNYLTSDTYTKQELVDENGKLTSIIFTLL